MRRFNQLNDTLMKGFYFHNSDIRSTRAHMCQVLNTAENIHVDTALELVMPRYHAEIDLEEIRRNNDLSAAPRVIFLRNFGIRSPRSAAFVLFNLPAVFFLLIKKVRKEVGFIYIRSNLFLPLAVAAVMLRVPIFYEIHRKPLSFGERLRDHAVSRMSAGIIVISDYLRGYYLNRKKKITVAHDAVSLGRFGLELEKKEARKRLGLAPEKSLVVYAGTISKLKGMDYLIAAADILPEVDFLLAGSISPEFQNKNFAPNVKFLGKKEQKDIPIILRAADALLLPHPENEYSQSPMKLFEYMASRVPIVASKLPSISEVLNDENAVLVEAGSGESLARGIEKVLENPHLARALAENSYNDALNHTWEKRGMAIAEFIRKSL